MHAQTKHGMRVLNTGVMLNAFIEVNAGSKSLCLTADMMVGALMKAFNVTWFDDRRLCHMEGCTPAMIGFKWDHAVRDYLDPQLRAPTLCCLSQATSQQVPPVEECTDPSQYHQVGPPFRHLALTASMLPSQSPKR